MDKMLIGIVVISLIVNCQLALAQEEVPIEKEIEVVDAGLSKVIETIKAAKAIVTGDKPELDEKTKEAMKDLVPRPLRASRLSEPEAIPIPQNILVIISNAQIQINLLNMEKLRLEAELETTSIEIELWKKIRTEKYFNYLADQGIKSIDYNHWILNNGVALYRK